MTRRRLLRVVEREREPVAPAVDLSKREREVLGLLARGLTNRRIAEALFLAPGTVRNLVSAIYEKLDIDGRSEAILSAWRHGLSGGGSGS